MTRAIVLVAVAGCAKVEPLAHDNRALVVVDDLAAPTKVTETGYTLVFGADGIRMPVALTYNRNPVIAPNARCRDPQLIGLALDPVKLVAAGQLGSSTLTTVIGVDDGSGSAIAQLEVAYDVPFTCPAGEQQLSGTTVFTLFPGRIHRRDLVTPVATRLASVTGCGQCEAPIGGGFTLASYWRVAVDVVAGVPRFVRPDGTPIGTAAVPPGTCALIDGKLVALAWRGTGGTSRIEESAFRYELLRDVPAVEPIERSIESDLVLGELTDPAQCGAMLGGASDPALVVDGTPVEIGPDGIYLTEARGDRIELTTERTIPHGFAVLVPRDLAHVYRVTSGASAVAHVRQRTDDGYLFWFDEPLVAGDTITIDVD
ncbi:MAG: hypothetical protein WKG01_10305 [Kofleriaceae bacterium]